MPLDLAAGIRPVPPIVTPFRSRPALATALATGLSTAFGAGLLSACVPAHRHPTWAIYPLQRRMAHDGLAVVSQPDGYGLHIWIDTDTRQSGRCQPRWSADAARLFNGNGTAPFSSGLAPRQEYFQAVARQDVRRALRQQSQALCLQQSPRSSFSWVEPPQRRRNQAGALPAAGGSRPAQRSQRCAGAGGAAAEPRPHSTGSARRQ